MKPEYSVINSVSEAISDVLRDAHREGYGCEGIVLTPRALQRFEREVLVVTTGGWFWMQGQKLCATRSVSDYCQIILSKPGSLIFVRLTEAEDV